MALKRAAVTTSDKPASENTAVISEEEKKLAKETRLAAEAQAREAAEAEAAEAKAREEAEQADDSEGQDPAPDAEAKPDAEPEAEAASKPEAEVAAEPVKAKEVAVKPQGEVAVTPASQAKNAMAAFGAEMAEQGFEGMELTGMSFDRLKMHEGKFQLGSDEVDIGETIFVQIMSTRNIYVVRQHDGQKAEMFYSYCPHGTTLTDGSSSQEILDKWLEDGYGDADSPLQFKTYIEGMAQLVNRDDEYQNHMVSLSIPPASKGRLAGAFAVGRQRFHAGPSDLVIKCTVGKKIGTGDEAFRPWVFTAHGLMTE